MQLMIFKNLLESCTDYVGTYFSKKTFRQVNTNRNVQIFQKLYSRKNAVHRKVVQQLLRRFNNSIRVFITFLKKN